MMRHYQLLCECEVRNHYKQRPHRRSEIFYDEAGTGNIPFVIVQQQIPMVQYVSQADLF